MNSIGQKREKKMDFQNFQVSKISVAHAFMALVQVLMDLGTSACATTVGREMIAVNVSRITIVPTKKTMPVCCQMNVTVQKIPLTTKACARNYVSEQKIPSLSSIFSDYLEKVLHLSGHRTVSNICFIKKSLNNCHRLEVVEP